MPKQWSAILGGKAMESVLIHHHCSARAYHAMASLVLCRVGRPCSVMIQCTWALIMLLYCTRDLPCVSCSVGYENGKQWKLSEAHCSRNLLEILPFFKLTLRHKQQLILFLISENIFKRCVLWKGELINQKDANSHIALISSNNWTPGFGPGGCGVKISVWVKMHLVKAQTAITVIWIS